MVVSPIALEVVRQIDTLFDIEREINGQSPEKRRALRQDLSKPIVAALRVYLEEKRDDFPRTHDLYKAINYMLKRWSAFTLFFDDGRVCLSNNAARARAQRDCPRAALMAFLWFRPRRPESSRRL